MITLAELLSQAAECIGGKIAVEEFEDWFSGNSRGVSRSGDLYLRDAVNAVESAFSRYYFEDLSEEDLRRELASAIRPFVATPRRRVIRLRGRLAESLISQVKQYRARTEVLAAQVQFQSNQALTKDPQGTTLTRPLKLRSLSHAV